MFLVTAPPNAQEAEEIKSLLDSLKMVVDGEVEKAVVDCTRMIHVHISREILSKAVDAKDGPALRAKLEPLQVQLRSLKISATVLPDLVAQAYRQGLNMTTMG